jgi:hypothetical protein
VMIVVGIITSALIIYRVARRARSTSNEPDDDAAGTRRGRSHGDP